MRRFPNILRFLRSPAFWLALFSFLQYRALDGNGSMEPQRVPDTDGYETHGYADTWEKRLAFSRTNGYPLFLRSMKLVTEDHAAVPEAHAVAYFGALLVLWLGLRRFSGSPWLAFAGVVPLLYGSVLPLITRIQPDVLGTAMAVAAVGCLFLWLELPTSAPRIAALTLTLLLSYQIRPAFLFMIALIPLTGLIVSLFEARGRWRPALRGTVALLVIASLPFLSFCAVRWAVVGHFGLVSFGGVNLIGAAANFLDKDLVRELPAEHRVLGRRIYRERVKEGFEPFTLDQSVRWPRQRYNPNVWRIAYPTVVRMLEQEQAREPDDDYLAPPENMVEVNRRLSGLGKSIIARRPALYRRWVASGIQLGLEKMLNRPYLKLLFLVTMLSVPLALIRRVEPATGGAAERADRRHACVVGIAAVAVGWYVGQLLLVSLVEYPIDRYLSVIVLPLAPMLSSQLFELWRRTLYG